MSVNKNDPSSRIPKFENTLTFVETGDGSKTIFNTQVGENYHSRHGALQESQHVFLNSGLQYYLKLQPVIATSILEIGFGTGLNFLLSADYCRENNIRLNYAGLEAFPLAIEMIRQTGYQLYVNNKIWESYIEKYPATLKQATKLSADCILQIAPVKLLDFRSATKFDVIYFDAFAVSYQPEMWNEEAIAHTLSFLKQGGVFVTYAITGNLKRLIKSLGCTIEKVPGALGKREMLRAVKI